MLFLLRVPINSLYRYQKEDDPLVIALDLLPFFVTPLLLSHRTKVVVVYKRWNSASELSSRANRERVGLYGTILSPLSFDFHSHHL